MNTARVLVSADRKRVNTMDPSNKRQILISGVGGQGVLFVTRLLAEAAIAEGLPVLTAETHGMAQRGGTVISHLKVGDFFSPLIRPGQADGLLALHAEHLAAHAVFLKPGAWIAVNQAGGGLSPDRQPLYALDANRTAAALEQPRAVNLVLLGFAAGKELLPGASFFSYASLQRALMSRMVDRPEMVQTSLRALAAGRSAAA